MLTDAQIQKKLDQLTRIANELDQEARRRWDDPGARLFYADSHFCIMSGESQKFIEFRSNGICRMDCGGW